MKHALVLLCITIVVRGFAIASCGSATCPLNNFRYMQAGTLEIGLRYEYIDQDRIYVGSSPSFIGALPNPHDEIQTLNELTVINAQYGISNAFSIGVEMPIVHREHRHREAGAVESFDFTGLGDIILSGQYTLINRTEELGPFFNIQFGMKFNSGVTDATSLGGEPAEVTIQPGTGSTDEILALNYRQTVVSVPTPSGDYAALPLIVGASYRISGKGTDGYRFGTMSMIHLGTEYQLAAKLGFLLQLNGMVRGYADVGSTGEFRSNTGGSWIFISPGLTVQLTDSFTAFSYVQFPLYQNVHGIQQTAPFNLELGVSANIKLTD